MLFRAPAGPRRGFGHMVRCRSLARALGVRPLVALRGRRSVEAAALALGCDVVRGGPGRLLGSLAPDVLIVDDPVAADAWRWVRAGRQAGCLVVSVHDLSLGCLDAALTIDGSATGNARRAQTLAGHRFALLDPALPDQGAERQPYTVLVVLGGGTRSGLAIDIAEAIVEADPRVRVGVSRGLVSAQAPVPRQITWLSPTRNLHAEMSRACFAVVGGGLSRHRACSHGTPAVGVAVVAARRPAVAAFVAQGAAAGVVRGPVSPSAGAAQCVVLLSDSELCCHQTRMGRRLIDGRDAFRAGAAVRGLAGGGPRQ